ncbi:MAG TPA: DUF1330 domain-containing protein [Solirubrobacteraceae bacterium]|nr:DUF1330 domain-containing protein [Solirubrobacteraceae bacterium]
MPIAPTQAQLEGLLAADLNGPIVMLNLLRFKDEADGIDVGVSGREAYRRYGEATTPFLERVGGRLLLAVDAKTMVIGPDALEWDMALMVEYPSREKFLEMASDPDYLAVHEHRAAALSDSRLIACQAVSAV